MVLVVGPLANVLVHLRGPLTATEADGTFRVEDVSVPYTVTVGVAGSEPWVHAFEGLTTYGGAGFHVAADGAFGGQKTSAWAAFAAGTTFELSLSAPPMPVSPDVDAPGVTAATPFTVLADTAVARQFHWAPTLTGSAPVMTLTTTSTAAHRPDVTTLGMSLPVGEARRYTLAP